MKCRPILLLALYFCLPPLCYAQQSATPMPRERPKVALVLSGGGARGAAHIGAIRFIEEMQIPIDMVTGTSMGAIVGALYAIGYTPDEMDSLLMAQDWGILLSNNVPRSAQPYVLRKAEQRYQVNVPYTNKGRTEGTARYRDAGIKVQKHSLRGFPKVLARPGLIDGQNLLNLFTQLTMAYHDSLSYSSLPRPYACVATDLVKGNAVVLDKGFLAESMRASMSIPGVFYPIYTPHQVLVDGGIVNNYPVDVARSMGADIVIGVDLSSGDMPPYALQSFPAIFERLIGTLGSDLRRRNVQNTNILIRPQVSSFPVMGFDTASLSRLISIGYHSAQKHREQLAALRDSLATTPSSPPPCTQGEQAIVLGSTHPYTLSAIVCPSNIRPLLQRYGIDEGCAVTASTLGEAIESIYGLGIYSAVQYHLLGEGPYTLVVDTQNNPTNQLEMGVRFDSEETAAALLSIGINRMLLEGPKFGLTARLSLNPWIEGHAAYAFDGLPQINASLRYSLSDVDRLYSKSSHAFSYHCYSADVYLSDLFSHYHDLRIGTRYDHFLVRNLVHEALPHCSYVDDVDRPGRFTCYATLSNDLFDAAYLPTHGYAYALEASYTTGERGRTNTAFVTLRGAASAALSLSRNTVLQPTLHMRWLFGDAIPFVYGNVMGGYMAGRYMRQQIPFAGFTGCEFMHRHLTVASIEVRQQLIPDIYLTGIANYAHSTNDLRHTFQTPVTWGMSIGLTCNTTLGPLSVYGHWNDMYHRFGAYLSIGYDF